LADSLNRDCVKPIYANCDCFEDDI